VGRQFGGDPKEIKRVPFYVRRKKGKGHEFETVLSECVCGQDGSTDMHALHRCRTVASMTTLQVSLRGQDRLKYKMFLNKIVCVSTTNQLTGGMTTAHSDRLCELLAKGEHTLLASNPANLSTRKVPPPHPRVSSWIGITSYLIRFWHGNSQLCEEPKGRRQTNNCMNSIVVGSGRLPLAVMFSLCSTFVVISVRELPFVAAVLSQTQRHKLYC
jgi:hypothetical protein